MKWYNVEIPYNTRETINRADNFKNWLHENNFKFEPSACGNMVHFEILMNPEDVKKVNNALDDLVWFDAITDFHQLKQLKIEHCTLCPKNIWA